MSWFERLREKHIFRTAFLYMGGAWAVTEAIGFFVDNEIAWGNDTSLAVAALVSPPTQKAKQAFVADLKAKYGDVGKLNAAWGTEHASWDAVLENHKAPNLKRARDDLTAFFFWAAWACVTERPGSDVTYTNNWPPDERVGNAASTETYFFSIAGIVALLVVLGLFVCGCVWLAYRVNVKIDYKWNWGIIPQYLYRYDPVAAKWVPGLIMQGLITTLRLSIWATLLAMLLGSVMGILRCSPRLFRRLLGWGYVELIRNIPIIVWIFIF